jgi:hypothetical protein
VYRLFLKLALRFEQFGMVLPPERGPHKGKKHFEG